MSRFARILLLIAFVALGVRVGYVLIAKHDQDILGDQIYYNAQANTIARGGGFTDFRDGSETAEHPPLTALALAPTSWIGDRIDDDGTNQLAHRLTMAVFGVAVVIVVALVGRTVAGERAGLIAGALAALSPNLWANDGAIMSETLAALAVALAILLAYRFWRSPTWKNAVWVGAMCGLAILVRAELALLLPVMVLPLAARAATAGAMRARLGLAAIAFVAAGVVVSPWVIANHVRIEKPVLFSTNDGLTLCGANTDNVYYGDGTGLWALDCAFLDVPKGDRSVVSDHLRSVAFDYVGDHLDRAPVVALARVGRVWNLYAPGQMADYSEDEGREAVVSWLGFAAFWILVPFAVWGAIVLHRRKVELWPLLSQVVVVTITAALIYGLVRFRVPAEIPLLVLAAAGIDALLTRRASTPDTPADAPLQSSTIEASSSS
jgi:4-amino-4-deoxy-L-arabinose transferase-like glycosyltransferase